MAMTMKFETAEAMNAWMSAARDSVLRGAACEVNWVHRRSCADRDRSTHSRGGADQACPCRPYAMLTIRGGERAPA